MSPAVRHIIRIAVAYSAAAFVTAVGIFGFLLLRPFISSYGHIEVDHHANAFTGLEAILSLFYSAAGLFLVAFPVAIVWSERKKTQCWKKYGVFGTAAGFIAFILSFIILPGILYEGPVFMLTALIISIGTGLIAVSLYWLMAGRFAGQSNNVSTY